MDLAASLEKVLAGITKKDTLRHPLTEAECKKCHGWAKTALKDVVDDPLAIELAAKTRLHEYSGNDDDTNKTSKLLDCMLYLSEHDFCETTLVHSLIEEMLDIETIAWCERFWHYMISREERLCTNLVGTKHPGLTLIRYCNRLMKRLSKNQHSQFSGTIAMFLARAFPLTEKSGLNIRGAFDTENVTNYEKKPGPDGDGDVDMEGSSSVDKPDDALYAKFWSLQEVFMDPTRLFNEPNLDEIKAQVTTVLAALRKSENSKGGGGSNSHYRKRRERRSQAAAATAPNTPAPQQDEDGVFTPKWLTKRDLFDLQMNDPAFRRTVTAQCIILFRFLVSLRAEEKKRWAEELKAVNRGVMYTFTLGEDDSVYFDKLLSSMVYNREGDFARTMRQVVKSEQAWQEWKLLSCPSFDKPPMDQSELESAKDKITQLQQPRKKFWHAMGTAALSKAWKIDTGIDKLKDNNTFTVPPTEDYYQKYKELKERKGRLQEMMKEEEVDKEGIGQQLEALEEEIACANWRGLRAARGQGHWVKFGKVTPEHGYAGLFDDIPPPAPKPESEPEPEPKKEPEPEPKKEPEPEPEPEKQEPDQELEEPEQPTITESEAATGSKRPAEEDDGELQDDPNTPSKRQKTE